MIFLVEMSPILESSANLLNLGKTGTIMPGRHLFMAFFWQSFSDRGKSCFSLPRAFLVPGSWSGTTLIICPSVLCQTVSKVPPSISDAGWVFDYKSVPQLQGGVRVQVVLHQHLYRHRHNNRMCRSWIPSAVHSFRCASFLKILTWQSWHKHTHCASLSWMFDSVHYPIKWKSTRCTGGSL